MTWAAYIVALLLGFVIGFFFEMCMGLLGFCVAQLAQTLALSLSPASDIALLSTASPLWIGLLAWLWLGERLGQMRSNRG